MAYHAFLDKERARVPVAGPMAFVGRRREAQAILGIFRDHHCRIPPAADALAGGAGCGARCSG
jgi:hypothetical protein